MKKHSKMFFESYNLAVEGAYDAYLKITEGDLSNGNNDKDDRLHLYLQNEYKKWLYTPMESLEERSPAEYLETVNLLSSLMEMFSYGAVACDEDLPEIFLEKLKSFGENGIDALLEVTAQNGASDSEGFLVPLMAVKILGAWKVERAAKPLIKLLYAEGEVYDLMFETVRDALVRIGDPALDDIFSALNSGNHSQTAIEYLIIALTDIGKMNPSDKIYLQLKKAFMEMPQKLIAANCLGNYGDGRAIPALRGYLERNRQQLDKETFYEIISAIQRLGGKANDLNL